MGNVKHVTGDPGWVSDMAAAGIGGAGMDEELWITVATSDGGLFHTVRHPYSWDPIRNMGGPGPVYRVNVSG
jgi:hypothetical protein